MKYVKKFKLWGEEIFIKDKEARDNIATLSEKVDNVQEIIPDVMSDQVGRYYVDGTNGNDENDGLTSGTAFKTLDRFFELARETKYDIRCYIISAGTYNVKPVSSFTSIAVHISATVNGVLVNFQTVQNSPNVYRNLAWYQCHLNIGFLNPTSSLDRITIAVNGGTDRGNFMYFDSGSFWFENCTFLNAIASYGAGGHFENCTICGLLMWWSKTRITNCIMNYNGSVVGSNYYLFRMYNTDVLVTGGDSQINIQNDGSTFALFQGCRIFFDRNFSDESAGTGTCTSGSWTFDGCVIPINQARFTGLKRACPNIDYGDSINIIGTLNSVS